MWGVHGESAGQAAALVARGKHQRRLPGMGLWQGGQRVRGLGELMPGQRAREQGCWRVERTRRYLAPHIAAEAKYLRGEQVRDRWRLAFAPTPSLPGPRA